MRYSFWEIIEQAKVISGEDWKSRPENLKSILLKYSAEDIVQFNKDYHDKLNEAYKWNLWGAAYLIKNGCSDDSFEYFRDFLISEGKATFESALNDPDSLTELDDIKNADLENYPYAIYGAYEELTKNEIPRLNVKYPTEPEGNEWKDEDLDSMFPKLAFKYERNAVKFIH